MKRRRLLAGLGVGATTALGGCTSMLTTNTSEASCPESPTPVESLDDHSGETVTIIGTVSEINKQAGDFGIENETGTVYVAGPPYPSTGACLRVEGRVSYCVGCDENAYYLDPASWERTD